MGGYELIDLGEGKLHCLEGSERMQTEIRNIFCNKGAFRNFLSWWHYLPLFTLLYHLADIVMLSLTSPSRQQVPSGHSSRPFSESNGSNPMAMVPPKSDKLLEADHSNMVL